MLFSQTITIPANTAQLDALEQEIRLAPSVITAIDVQFPQGSYGLTHIQLLRGTHQIAPFDLTQDIASDQETVRWSEELILDRAPFIITIRGWNNDETYQHIITVRVLTRPLTAADLKAKGGDLPEALQRLLFED